MEKKENLIEPLFERVEQYAKTSYELLKLKSIDKTTDVASSLVSRLLLVLTIFLFVFILNIGAAFWLGELLGKIYYGFFIVSSFYALIGIILITSHRWIKKRVSNTIITQVLN